MTGAAAALAASPAADSGSEFPGVLDGVLLAGPAARLAAMLDQAFLAGAGWDPGSRVLSLPAGHPLLGRVVCRAGGCDATAHGTKTGGLCWRCFARLTRAGLSAGEITSSPELPPLPDWTTPGLLEAPQPGEDGAMSNPRYTAEMRERAVKMVMQVRRESGQEKGAVARVAQQLGIGREALRGWVAQAEVDSGARPGTTSDDKQRIKELERENSELRRANEILKAASAYFARELGPSLPR